MKGGFDDWKSIHVSKVSRLSNIFFFFFDGTTIAKFRTVVEGN